MNLKDMIKVNPTALVTVISNNDRTNINELRFFC